MRKKFIKDVKIAIQDKTFMSNYLGLTPVKNVEVINFRMSISMKNKELELTNLTKL